MAIDAGLRADWRWLHARRLHALRCVKKARQMRDAAEHPMDRELYAYAAERFLAQAMDYRRAAESIGWAS